MLFGDDGDGMSPNTLENCLSSGFPLGIMIERNWSFWSR